MMRSLIDEILRRVDHGERVAICAIVRTRGSTPQARGATMLVLGDGRTLGTLGGGCVEAEVRSRAMQLMQDRASRLMSFKLDHDHTLDDGLVCGGTMDVAVQVIESAEDARSWREAGEQLAAKRVATVTMRVSDEQGSVLEFAHALAPTPTVIIAGAGHVGRALGEIAQRADFDLVVIDDRPDYASPDRFPAGTTCVVGEVEQELSRWAIDENSYVVIVTRGHRRDGRALAAVIASRAKYIGLIGSRRKIITILRDLLAAGVPREQLLRVRAPIGLDIGAITPGEIAVSIAAELIAVRRGLGDAPAVTPMRISPKLLDEESPHPRQEE
jgi:xanthine dehydrogenase accessory factor